MVLVKKKKKKTTVILLKKYLTFVLEIFDNIK